MSARWLVLLVAFPVAYTAMALTLVSMNRAGGREPIVLTEREAEAPFRNEENSATRLRLVWHLPLAGPEATLWFDREKLGDVGFDVSVDPAASGAEAHYRRVLPRAAFVALEYDGPAWRAYVDSLPPPGTDPAVGGAPEFVATSSRLVPVDVAADADTLAGRYPDGRTHLITAGVVRLDLVSATSPPSRMAPVPNVDPATPPAPYLMGQVIDIDPDQVYVPRDLARQLPPRDRETRLRAPFTVAVGYGTRWEPYVVSITPGAGAR